MATSSSRPCLPARIARGGLENTLANRVAVIIARVFASLAAVVFVFAAVQPPAPGGPGLDESWRFGISMAALSHLRFGHDIVFTYGPLGYILEGFPIPELARPTAYVNLGLALVAVWGLWTACSGRSSLLFRCALLAGAFVTVASVGIDYVAFLGVIALLARLGRSPKWAPFAALAVSLVGVFGLLSKQTLGLEVFGCAGIFWLVQLVQGPRRRRRSALLSIAIATVLCAVTMLLVFGSVRNALEYVSTSGQIIGGFASAMAIAGPTSVVAGAIAIFVVTAVAAVALVPERKAAIAGAVVVALFLAWKHGFVRADAHVMYFFLVAGAVVPLLGIVARSRRALIASLIASAASFLGLAFVVLTFGINLAGTVGAERLGRGATYLLDPVASARRGQAVTAAALTADRLPREAVAAIGTSGVDVLAAETVIVPANGLRWQPLPVFQSYHAFTPALDALDREALVNRGARFELFKFEDIDLRYPLSSEPATFAQLLCRYSPVPWRAVTRASGEYIALERRAETACVEEPIRSIPAAALNTPLPVPPLGRATDVIRGSFGLRLTPLGAIAAVLWRPPVVLFRASYRNGDVRVWHLVAATAIDGLIVSPMPRNSAEARRLFARQPLPDAAVTSIEILTRPGFYRLDTVSFSRLRR